MADHQEQGEDRVEFIAPIRQDATDTAVDDEAARAAVAALLTAIGFDPKTERFAETPARVAEALTELTTAEPIRFSTFANTDNFHGPIVVRDIEFISLCEHHLLPFHGRAHVGYIPDERIAGLSVLAHVVEAFSRDLQLQEVLTQRVAETLMSELRPRAVGVVIEAEHMCMVARGPRARGTTARTSVFLGSEADTPQFHAAFERAHGDDAEATDA